MPLRTLLAAASSAPSVAALFTIEYVEQAYRK